MGAISNMPRISLLYCLVLLGSRYVFASYKLPRLGFLRLLGTLPSDSGSEGLPRQINRKSLRPRDDTVVTISTCGFLTGDPTKPRTAEVGYACRVDTENALWGFCPESVIQASDCGLAGACQDSHGCESICGIFGVADITTVSWYEDACSDLQ